MTVLEPGHKWEAEEPEDCMMVPDTAGLLVLYISKRDEEDDDVDLDG